MNSVECSPISCFYFKVTNAYTVSNISVSRNSTAGVSTTAGVSASFALAASAAFLSLAYSALDYGLVGITTLAFLSMSTIISLKTFKSILSCLLRNSAHQLTSPSK